MCYNIPVLVFLIVGILISKSKGDNMETEFATNECKKDALCKRMRDMIKKICSCKIKEEMDLSLSLIPDENGNEELSKHIKSSGEFKLVKTAAILAAMAVAVSAICCVCSLFKKLSCK